MSSCWMELPVLSRFASEVGLEVSIFTCFRASVNKKASKANRAKPLQYEKLCSLVMRLLGLAGKQSTMYDILRISRLPLTITSIFGNLAVLIVLLRYKALRKSSSNMLIAQLAFAGLVLGFGLLIRGIQTEIYIAMNITVYYRDTCMLYGATSILGMNLLQTTTVMITIDRLSAFAFPLFYRRSVDSERFSIVRFIVCLGASLISFSGQFIGRPISPFTEICSSGAAWTHGYRFYFMVFSAGVSILTIALNAIVMIIYHQQMQISLQKKQNSVVITQTSIMVSYIIFWCIPTIVYLVAMILGYGEVIFGTITLILAIGSGFFASLNPFLFLWKHTEFRSLFVCFYCRKKITKHASISVVQNVRRCTISKKANDTAVRSITPA